MSIIAITKNSKYRVTATDKGFVITRIKVIENESNTERFTDEYKGTDLHLKKGDRLILTWDEEPILRTGLVLQIQNKRFG